MGEIVNLAMAWEPFKAAKTALANTLEASNVETAAARSRDQLEVRNNCYYPDKTKKKWIY